jgi:hypothetical protein
MEFLVVFFWFGLTLIVGAIGSKRNIGFSFSFLWSVLLSPIIGLVITLLSKPKINRERLKESILNQLDKVSSLKEKEIISESQFEEEKKQLTYRLNNIDEETNTSKTPHYIALISLVLLLIISFFGFKKYLENKDIKAKRQLELRENDTSSPIYSKDKATIDYQKSNISIISGIATYGSDGIPDFINVYAQDVNSGKIFKYKLFDRKQGYFEIQVPQGSYYVYSTNAENQVKPNKNQIVNVFKEKIENINAQDLSVSNFVPVIEKENYETSNITLRLLENLTDLKNINPSKVQTQLQSFNENWRFRNDYSENGEYFFGKQNEVILLRLKGKKNTLFYSFLDEKTFEEIKEQINTYVDLKILKTENDKDYNKKYYETSYHKIMLAEVKEDGEIFGYNIMMSIK